MYKRELRLAVVIYGGASLAVYMHGVTKELLKLVRASKVLHEVGPDTAIRYEDGPDRRTDGTEGVYFELLKRINRSCHFRVVVDVIAGASAGAINGIMLGKALVDDGELNAQTPLWLRDADVEGLLPADRSRWQKWYLYPLLRALSLWLPDEIGAVEESRSKLTQLVRSSWFKPPFSGERLDGHFIDALDAMVASRRTDSTLLPDGQRLDVYASITDLSGYPSSLRLSERLVPQEREHAAHVRLSHVADAQHAPVSDFHNDNLAGLVWAARASSSYAGAFPPFHHNELQRVLRARKREWPREQIFLQRNVFVHGGEPAESRFDPADRYFVDGGIVNNKPFSAILDALSQRSADRHVDRCVIYIEPDPTGELDVEPSKPLGYLATIRAAVSTIPRNQPILAELDQFVAQDKRVRANRRLVDSHRQRIQEIVDRLQAQHARQPLSPELIAYLRIGVAERAVEEMGLAYRAYVQRRVWRLSDALVNEWSQLVAEPYTRETHSNMMRSIEQWWQAESEVTRRNLQDVFLDRFDVTYRIRRLQFVIRRLNQHDDIAMLSEAEHAALDRFKSVAYGFLERLFVMRNALSKSGSADSVFEGPLLDRLAKAALQIPLSRQQSADLLRALAASLELSSMDGKIDDAVYEFCHQIENEDTQKVFISDYVGFSVYDVLLFSASAEDGGPDPLTPIRIERISPADAKILSTEFRGLRCRDLMGFLGFFNRGYREHDYLWGRLHGAERLVDLLQNVSSEPIADLERLRIELFQQIVAEERRRLYRCGEDFDRLSRLLDQLASAAQ
jgi:patatin-related protein